MRPDRKNPSDDGARPTGETDKAATRHARRKPAAKNLPRMRRDVNSRDLAGALRAAVGLPPDRESPSEQAAWFHCEVPEELPLVDVDAWLGWALAGLPLFAGRLPGLRHARDTAAQVVLVVAMTRAQGNISAVSRTLGHARKVVRDSLVRSGLYPWPAASRGAGSVLSAGYGRAADDR